MDSFSFLFSFPGIHPELFFFNLLKEGWRSKTISFTFLFLGSPGIDGGHLLINFNQKENVTAIDSSD